MTWLLLRTNGINNSRAKKTKTLRSQDEYNDENIVYI
jgi:hypothetical protein